MTARRWAVGVAITGVGAVALCVWRARRTARTRSCESAGFRTDDGVRLHVEVDGPTDASVTVVLVHGFAARSSMWDLQWVALRGSARVVRYDQRGHGRSGWRGRLRTGPARLGRDLGEVVDRCTGVGPAVLVGHSMDGMAVLALAGSRPELFGSRVAGVAPLPTAGQGSGDRAMRLRTALAMLAARIVWLASPLVHAVHPFRTRPVQRLLRRRLFAGDPPEGAMRQMTDAWIRTPTTVMSATLPVLVLAGAEGRHHPGRRRRAARRPDRPDGPPGARARAGHMVPLTHAPAVNTALLDLLAGARPASDGRRTS